MLISNTILLDTPNTMQVFIGTTSLLNPQQCQNDIWLTFSNPGEPAVGDIRFLVGGGDAAAAKLFVEMFTQHQGINRWVVVDANEYISFYNIDENPVEEAQVQLIAPGQVPNHVHAENNVVTCFEFPWVADLVVYPRADDESSFTTGISQGARASNIRLTTQRIQIRNSGLRCIGINK